MALKSMRRTKPERDAESKADGMPGDGAARPAAMPPERDDIDMRLEHHHIQKLGLDGPLPHGTPVRFHGEGEVGDSGTHESDGGEPRHHMTIRLSRAGVEHDAPKGDEAGGALRDELKKNTDASEAKTANRDAARGRERTGGKVAEKVGG